MVPIATFLFKLMTDSEAQGQVQKSFLLSLMVHWTTLDFQIVQASSQQTGTTVPLIETQ